KRALRPGVEKSRCLRALRKPYPPIATLHSPYRNPTQTAGAKGKHASFARRFLDSGADKRELGVEAFDAVNALNWVTENRVFRAPAVQKMIRERLSARE